MCLTPAIFRGCATPAAARGAVAAGCSSWTLTAGTPGIAATAAFTSVTIFSTTSGFADAIVSDTVTPAYATSISLMIPNDTMSRVKPGYFTFLSSARISLGLGIVRIGPVGAFDWDEAALPRRDAHVIIPGPPEKRRAERIGSSIESE